MPKPIHWPLSEIARLNRPLASGEPTRPASMQAPADWPKMVTLSGSPPNWAMLAFTHFRVAMASARAWLPEALCPDSAVSSGCDRKPSAPTR